MLFKINAISTGHYPWAAMSDTREYQSVSFALAISRAMQLVSDEGQTITMMVVDTDMRTALIRCATVADGIRYTLDITVR